MSSNNYVDHRHIWSLREHAYPPAPTVPAPAEIANEVPTIPAPPPSSLIREATPPFEPLQLDSSEFRAASASDSSSDDEEQLDHRWTMLPPPPSQRIA